jgi:hypothetical protein
MSHRMIIIAVALTLVTLAAVSCQKAEKEEPQAIVESEVWVAPDSLVFEQVWLYFTDKPEVNFEKTISDLDAESPERAAHDLRTASAYLKIEAARARGDSRKALRASIRELEDTADQIEGGTVVETSEMERIFARAHYALAEHHYRRAAALWRSKEQIKAGEELDVAVTHLEHGLGWVTHHEYETRPPWLQAVAETAGEMTEGKLMKPETVKEAMTGMEQGLGDLRTRLEQA